MITTEMIMAFPAVFMRILGAMLMLPIGQHLSGIGKTFAISFALSFFFATYAKTAISPGYCNLFF